MAMCPNCGEMVMDGDPYCSHCGSTLRWYYDEKNESLKDDGSSVLKKVFDLMVKSGMSTDERFDLFKEYLFMPDYMLEEIRESIHETEKLYKCSFVMVYTKPYPQVYIFLRQDKLRDVLIFERCYVEYMPTRFDPDGFEIHYSYSKLYDSPEFQSKVKELEREGYELKGVYSNILSGVRKNALSVSFSKGNDEVTYLVDDDLNFRKLG